MTPSGIEPATFRLVAQYQIKKRGKIWKLRRRCSKSELAIGLFFYPELETRYPCEDFQLNLIGSHPCQLTYFLPSFVRKARPAFTVWLSVSRYVLPSASARKTWASESSLNSKSETAHCQLILINKERSSLIRCRNCTFLLVYINWITCRNVQFTLSSLETVSEDLLADHGGCSNMFRIVTVFQHGHAAIYRDADEYSWCNKYYISGLSAMCPDNDRSEL